MAREARQVAILGVGTIGESLLRGLLSGGWRGYRTISVVAAEA